MSINVLVSDESLWANPVFISFAAFCSRYIFADSARIRIASMLLYEVCGAVGDWTMSNFVHNQIETLKEKLGNKKVLCAMHLSSRLNR